MLFYARCALTTGSLFAATGAALPASWPHVRLGGVSVNAGYNYYYDPFLFGYVHPGFYTGFAFQPLMGQVHLHTKTKTAWVYVDGGLAGRADKLKNIWLEPGTYEIEIRDGGQAFNQRIYVLSGKTLTLKP